MSLASGRERRANAGNRMSQLLDKHEEDEFYKTTYGGFSEDEEDEEYRSEKEEEDVVDSDFDIDETDEVKSDHEEEQTTRRVVRGVFTKAYKEPLPKKKAPDGEAVKKPAKSKKPARKQLAEVCGSVRRRSTLAKSAETQRRQRENDELRRRRKQRVPVEPRQLMTQQQRLEEAKITEQENLNSLEKYLLMETEKRKARPAKKLNTGPMIRYRSVTERESVPPKVTSGSFCSSLAFDDIKIEFADDLDSLGDKNDAGQTSPLVTDTDPASVGPQSDDTPASTLCERTYISFSDPSMLSQYFPQRKPVVKARSTCPITRLPARYFDPITRLPYANVQAIKVLREAYYQQLELKGNRSVPEVAKWLDWRKEQKERRAKLMAQRRQMNINMKTADK